MESRPKIAHVTPSYLPTLGGKETYIYDVVQGLPDFEFVILTGRVWGQDLVSEDDRIQVIPMRPSDPYRGPRALPSPHRLEMLLGHGLSTLRLLRQRRTVETRDCALVHSHWSDVDFTEAFGGILPETARLRLLEKTLRLATFREPTVFTDHSMFLQRPTMPERMLLVHALQVYDVVVCVEPEGRARAKVLAEDVSGSADIRYIPNSVNCELFAPTQSTPERPPTIGYLGRANKGYQIVFDLTRRLKEFQFQLIVAGDRRSLKKWRAITSNRVRLRENVPPWDLPAILHQCDVVVSPLLHPAITRVTLEALACGIPVVAADGESRYPLINGKTGLLVKPSSEGFERGLRELLPDHALRLQLGKEGRRLVATEFSDETVLPQLGELYRRLTV